MRLRRAALWLTLSLLAACSGGGGPAGPGGAGSSIAVSVAPNAVHLQAGQVQAFLATVTGGGTAGVAWSVDEAAGGQVNAAGQYTAPQAAGTFHVRATALADLSKSATATVTVEPPISVGISPTAATVVAGQVQVFTATVGGSANTQVAWSVLEAGGGSIDGSGRYSAPPTPGTFHVQATSVADPARTALATVTVVPGPQVTVGISPASASLQTGQTQTFSAAVSGTSNGAVTWSVLEAGGGTVSPSGLYAAPGTAGTYHVRATSVADPGASALATVSVTAVAVAISPASASLQTGQTRQFSATVTGTANGAVLWSVLEAGGGSITLGGLYTAPALPGTYHVRATSAADPARSADAVVSVAAASPATVTISPASATLRSGQPQLFTATVAGTSNPSVTWSVVEPFGGGVSPEGLYSAPASAGTFHVRATSVARPEAYGEATITVEAPPVVTVGVAPAAVSLQAGQSQAFAATVGGSPNPAVTWTVVEAGGGGISAAGTYTAPAGSGTYHVRATSVAEPSAWGQATVTVTAVAGVTIAVSPQAASVQTGQSQAFTAAVGGSPNTAVTWTVVEAGGGSVSAAGTYTAPASAGTYHVRATSVADPSRWDQATVAVTSIPPAGPCNSADLGAGASLRGYRPFPADNAWNQDISASPVDPNSAAIIAFIGATRGLKADFGSGLWEGAPIGIPYQVVDSTQPRVKVTFTAYGDESDPGPMPVPASAPVEGGPAATGDRHVLIMDRDACVLYELYRAFPQPDGSWNADSAAIWDLKSNALRPFGWTSADAAGLPVFPGLARYDEVAAGEITHALRFTVPTTRRAYVLPATHWASSNTSANAPPMGMRVRLKAGVDIAGYPAQAQVVLRALKKYGMILADNGSAWYITGAPNEGWINDQLATLGGIKGSDLEVVQMGTVYTADPGGAAPTIGSFAATPASIAPGGTASLAWSASNATRFFVTPEVGWTPGSPVTVRPAATTTYTLTAEGPYGSATRTVNVTVIPAAPPSIAAFGASPAAIAAGQSSTLSWSVSGATSLSIDPGPGPVSGASTRVSPTATTTYTLTASNGAGSTTALATVTVPAPPGIASFTATPATIAAGQGSTLAWVVTGATSLSLDQGVGPVTGTSTGVSPAASTTYTLTASGPGGTTTATATVTVTAGMHHLAAYGSGPAAPTGLLNSWIREAWEGAPPVATNLAAPAPGRPGSQAMEVAFGPSHSWNAVGLAHRLDWSNIYWLFFNQFRTLEFDLQFAADSSGEDNLVLILEDGGHADERPLTSFIPGWALLPQAQRRGTWFHVSIDLAGLHPRPAFPCFERWLLFNNADAAASRPHFFLADVKLGWVDDAQPPALTLVSATPNPTATELALAWNSDEPTAYSLEWGATPAYGQTLSGGTAAEDFTTAHTATLTGLAPGTTCHYRITARDHQFLPGAPANSAVLTGSMVLPAAPTTPPQVSNLRTTAVAAVTATLAWTTDRPCRASLSCRTSGGPLLERSLTDLATDRSVVLDLLEPSSSYTATLVATDAFGNVSAPAQLAFTTSASGSADVTVTINPAVTQAISPWIYGINFFENVDGAPSGITLNRTGGNRWTAYNWENNASNAGSDWGPYSSDSYLGGGSTPAEAVRSIIAADQGRGMASLVTVQLQGYVAADKAGLVNIADPNHLANRFKPVVFRKGSAFTAAPNAGDGVVYMDEFLWALRSKFSADPFAAEAQHPTFISLDNEPELWGDTHAEIQTGLMAPASYIQRTIDLAKALKDVAPAVQLFGPVHYGFNGIVNWQNSPGFTSTTWFTDKYLQDLRTASEAAGRRLLDAYDLHWYSEATGDGTRITNLSGATLTPGQVQAIVQSPRSLWDPNYAETSWITQYLGQPVNLLGRLKAKIAAAWPGTRIALTEYGNGGDNHIAGTLAQADNLGIFAAQGVYAANLWPLNDCPYILAGFRAFRGFDGGSANFGDVALQALSSQVQNVSAHVSLDSQVPGRVVVVAINRSTASQTVAFQGLALAGTARVYRITADSAQSQQGAGQPVAPVLVGQVPVAGGSMSLALPPLSVSTIEVQ